MSRITTVGLLIVSLAAARANAQRPISSLDRAPIPRQVLNARTVFIGNGGGQSFGAESYFSRTKYDGGPNRAYDAFYTAVKDWGHYDVVGSTDAADVALVIKFASPIVDHQAVGAGDGQTSYPVYDPQLDLSINDPHTGLPLWTITEHIEPGDNRDEDNRHFDEAIGRLVNDLRRLILTPDLALVDSSGPPPGAMHLVELHRHQRDLLIGTFVGTIAGIALGSRTSADTCPSLPTTLSWADLNSPLPQLDLSCEMRRSKQQFKNQLYAGIGGAIIGGLVGWILPVNF